MNTDTEQLKPCPFCGGEASGYPNFEDANSSTPGCYITCHECDCSPDGCYRPATEWAEAVRIWNTRSDHARIAELEAENADLRQRLEPYLKHDETIRLARQQMQSELAAERAAHRASNRIEP